MWFAETPWPPILLCVGGIVLLMIAWSRNARQAYLVGMLGLVALAVVIYIVEDLIVTEDERVEQQITDLVRSFESADRKACVELFAPLAQRRAKEVIGMGIKRVRVPGSFRIKDVKLDRRGDKAEIEFRVNGTIVLRDSGGAHTLSSHWRASLRKFDGEWKIIRLVYLDLFDGSEWESYKIE